MQRALDDWEATCRELCEETAPGSAPWHRLRGDVKGNKGSSGQAGGGGVCLVCVGTEPCLGGTGDTQEQQDGGRQRWEMLITQILLWTPRTWAQLGPSAPCKHRSDRRGGC